MNDILAEDNQTFTQENYKFNPPEKQIEHKKVGRSDPDHERPWPDRRGIRQAGTDVQ